MTAVHQFLPVFAAGDAIGNHVLRIRDALRDAGYDSEIFADDIHPPVRRHARPFTEFTPPPGGKGTHLLYHLSTGSRMAAWLADQPCPLAVDYHNITPAEYFDRWQPQAAEVARAARAEMRRLASSVAYGLADSSYNAAELVEEGYADTAVVPILIDFADFDSTAPDPATLTRLRRRAEGGGAHWVFVGRVAANKCQHDIVAAFAVYRQLFDPKARLSIVGGRTLLLYSRALERLADELGVADAVDFTNDVKFPQLLAYYRAADVFVSLSEHEGFCVPLVEAMHFGVPTVAYASTAVPETVGDATLLLPGKDPLEVAVAVQRVLTDDGVRKGLIEAGHRRVEHFSLENNRRRLLEALEPRIAAHG
ncbi:MAG TPA: glycosyltransferase [Acidimicrobiia bacterium]|nr:glycosyltransferase [Acidimicrobiia bacterium]